jgi:hypothetical protein
VHRSDSPDEPSLREALHADVARRLRGVCGELSESDFHALVARIVDVKIRYAPGSADAAHSPRRPRA